MRLPETLGARLALWVAGLLLVALVAFSVAVYTTSARGLYNSLDHDLRLAASEVAHEIIIDNGKPMLPVEAVDQPIGVEWQRSGVTIRIFRPDGELVQTFGPGRNLPAGENQLSAAKQRRVTIENLLMAPGSDQVRLYSGPLLVEDRLVGLIQVALSLDSVRSTLELLSIVLLAGVPLLVVLAGGSGYYLVRRTLAPIDHIIGMAERISTGDLSARLNLPHTPDEVGRLAAATDRMLDHLEESFQRERQFTSDASHELRTPLAAMRTILATERERQRTPEEYEQALADLADETDRLHSLVENLLLLARNASSEPARFEAVDITTMLCDVADSLRPLAENKGLYMRCRAAPGLALMGDGDSLIRLVVNLLDNAIKYTHQGGITLRATRVRQRNAVKITISDTGIGIAPEHQPHIFDRFYRADSARSEHGAGLGLAIAADIAKAHSGRIQVESVPGQGTTFSLVLGGALVEQKHSFFSMRRRSQPASRRVATRE